MGEIADMMIEGEICECCGEYLGEGGGFAQLCAGCADGEDVRESGFGGYQRVDKGHQDISNDQPISKKLLRRLETLLRDTDEPPGMYPGDHYKHASKQYSKLIQRGYAETYHPHNPIHDVRVIITDQGRDVLSKRA